MICWHDDGIIGGIVTKSMRGRGVSFLFALYFRVFSGLAFKDDEKAPKQALAVSLDLDDKEKSENPLFGPEDPIDIVIK